jgi:hypothetical protein
MKIKSLIAGRSALRTGFLCLGVACVTLSAAIGAKAADAPTDAPPPVFADAGTDPITDFLHWYDRVH